MRNGNGNGSAWELGQRIADRYEVREVLQDSSTCRLYAVRDVLRSNQHLLLGPGTALLQKRDGLSWFADYCRDVLRVPSHPNVLAAREMDFDNSDVPFLLMPYAEGEFWNQCIRGEALCELDRMLKVATESARGLAWLHRHGQIHYNMKPHNVLLCNAGFAKVLKFGQAGARTRAYASPEQLARDRLLRPATDAWSWGLCVLEMFNGRPNWERGDQAAEALQRYQATGPARSALPSMPSGLYQLLRRVSRQDPDERPQDMMEIVSALENISSQHARAEQGSGESPEEELTGEGKRRRFSRPSDRRKETGHWRLNRD